MFEKTVLPNGLRVLTSSMPHTRSVAISIYIAAGARYETDEQAGISHFVEHMLFKGTAKRPRPEDVSGVIEGVGGIINASTDREITVYWCKVARPHFLMGLDLLVDMLHHSTFLPAEVEKERGVIIEELNQVQDSPAEIATLLIDEILWPDQPLGRDVGGSKETVGGIKREQLLSYLEQQYGAKSAVIVVAGDITHQEVLEAISTGLKDWTTIQPAALYPAVNGRNGTRLKVENRKTEQAHICVAVPGLSSLHPDRYALTLMNTVLGEGMTSRLFLDIRERRGLAYDVHSYLSQFIDTGALTVYAGVDPKNAPDTVKAIVDQLMKLRDGVPEEELNKARELTKGRLLLRMEDTRAVAGWIGTQEVLTNDVKTVDEIVQVLDAVTVDDVQRVATSLIKEDHVTAAVVGPFRSERKFRTALAV